MPIYLSPRTFITAAAVVVTAIGVFLLATPTSTYVDRLYGRDRIGCGSAPESIAACEHAIDTRRAWGWPLLIVGGLGVAGALFIAPAPGRRAEQQVAQPRASADDSVVRGQ